MIRTLVRGLVAFCLFMPLLPSLAAEAPAKPVVSYNEVTDRLSVEAREAPLKAVLARIAILSGVDIWMDPQLETRKISTSLKDRSLEDGLKQLARGTSHVLVYDRRPGDAKPGGADIGLPLVVIAMKLLPEGKYDNSQLKPVLELEHEAFIREKEARRLERKRLEGPDRRRSLIERRWQERMSRLPPPLREDLEKKARARLDMIDEQHAEHEKNRAEREARAARQRARREAELAKLKEMNPERYALAMQRREEVRSLAVEQLKAAGNQGETSENK